MEQILNEIQTKINFLKNKIDKYNNLIGSGIEVNDRDEIWTAADADFLNNLLQICNFLKSKCYNLVLEDIRNNDNSVIERYCEVKKKEIEAEIKKHKSKYILAELREELERLSRIVENKNTFVEAKEKLVLGPSTNSDIVNGFIGEPSSVKEQLCAIYFGEGLHPSYKLVLDQLLDGNFEHYNDLGRLSRNNALNYELHGLENELLVGSISDKVENYLNNPMNSEGEMLLREEVFNYVSKFVKYKEYFNSLGIQIPHNTHSNYFEEVQTFLKIIIENNIIEKISNEITKESEKIQSELPAEYNDIEYGFFGTTTGKPGVVYYHNSSEGLESARNLKYLCDLLVKAQKLDGKGLTPSVVEEVNKDIIDSIDSEISFKSR